jgi:N-dimethylarginine dimethylaminohydrolase
LNEYSPLKRVAVRGPKAAFRSPSDIDREWQALRFHEAPSFDGALSEHEAFTYALKLAGAEVVNLGPSDALTLDSLYVRDALIVTARGLIACHMGRASRRGEPLANAAELERRTGLKLLGEIKPPGTLEGGDVIRLDAYTIAVGIGPRTNHAGVDQLQALLGPNVAIHRVPLPAPDHPDDVFHLMSMISPLDVDLALVYAPLIPKPFSDWLSRHGIEQISVPDDEFPTMGCNVLATGPRQALMLSGLPKTQQLLENHGVTVATYAGNDISRKGEGGPTCLTLPLHREAAPFL